MRRAPLFVAVAVVVAAVTPLAAPQEPATPPFVLANPWDPPERYSAPSLCDIHDDLRTSTRLALTEIGNQRPSSTLTSGLSVAIANAKGTAVLIKWLQLEFWMDDARAQDPDFACYDWSFAQPEDSGAR